MSAFLVAAALAACGPGWDFTVSDRSSPEMKPTLRNALNYPDKAWFAGQIGSVEIGVDIDEDGVPISLCIGRSTPRGLFDESAAAAVSSWRWRRGPSGRRYGLTVNFDLEPPDPRDPRQWQIEDCEAWAPLYGDPRTPDRLPPRLPFSPISRGETIYPAAALGSNAKVEVVLVISLLPDGRAYPICVDISDRSNPHAMAFMASAVVGILNSRWDSSDEKVSRGPYSLAVLFQIRD